MDVSSVNAPKGPRGLPPDSKANEIVKNAFGPIVGLAPVDSATVLQRLSEPSEAKTLPSYTLAAQAVIRAAAAAEKE